MLNLEAILQYQEIDRGLYAMERELSACEERKKYVTLKKFWESAPEKLDALEVKATAFGAEAKALSEKYEQVEATLGDFEHVEELISDGADVSYYKKQAQAVFEQLKKVKAELNALMASIKATDEEYQKLKKQVLTVKKQLVPAQEAYKAVQAEKAGEKSELEKKLAEIEPSVDGALLARYKTKRKEKVFPVFVALYDNRCSACSMDVPVVASNKLDAGEVIECDSCHRIIYKK